MRKNRILKRAATAITAASVFFSSVFIAPSAQLSTVQAFIPGALVNVYDVERTGETTATVRVVVGVQSSESTNVGIPTGKFGLMKGDETEPARFESFSLTRTTPIEIGNPPEEDSPVNQPPDPDDGDDDDDDESVSVFSPELPVAIAPPEPELIPPGWLDHNVEDCEIEDCEICEILNFDPEDGVLAGFRDPDENEPGDVLAEDPEDFVGDEPPLFATPIVPGVVVPVAVPETIPVFLPEPGLTEQLPEPDLPVFAPTPIVPIVPLPEQPVYAPTQTVPAPLPELPVYAPGAIVPSPQPTPDVPVFAPLPELPVFAPEQPVFTPELPVFAPERPVFAPEMPVFAPEQPVFAPEPTPTPAAPVMVPPAIRPRPTQHPGALPPQRPARAPQATVPVVPVLAQPGELAPRCEGPCLVTGLPVCECEICLCLVIGEGAPDITSPLFAHSLDASGEVSIVPATTSIDYEATVQITGLTANDDYRVMILIETDAGPHDETKTIPSFSPTPPPTPVDPFAGLIAWRSGDLVHARARIVDFASIVPAIGEAGFVWSNTSTQPTIADRKQEILPIPSSGILDWSFRVGFWTGTVWIRAYYIDSTGTPIYSTNFPATFNNWTASPPVYPSWPSSGITNWLHLEPLDLNSSNTTVRVHAWGWPSGAPSGWNTGGWNPSLGWNQSVWGSINNIAVEVAGNPGFSGSRFFNQSGVAGTVTFPTTFNNLYYVRAVAFTPSGSLRGPTYTLRGGINWLGSWDQWRPGTTPGTPPGWPWWNEGTWTGAARDRQLVETRHPQEVTATTATVSANIPNRAWNIDWNPWDNRIVERGFVWSTSDRMPTVASNVWRETTSAGGTFTHTISALTPGTTYYVSAFFRTPTRVFYGNVMEFRTSTRITEPGAPVAISAQFRTLAGQELGTTTVNTTIGSTLAAAHFTMPPGYVIWPPNWSYVVTGEAGIMIMLSPAGDTPQNMGGTPGGQGMAAGEFFPGRGGFTFEPDTPVSRGELAQAIFNLRGGGAQPSGQPLPFTDTANSPFANAINFVTASQLMNGYPDGTFRANGQLTRAEAAAVLVRMYGFTGTGTTVFHDMHSAAWAQNYVALAADRGIINGYPDGTFGPNRPLSRAEATALLVRSADRGTQPLSQQRFTDVPEWHWAFQYIMSAAVPRP